jgi:hypothetical protein
VLSMSPGLRARARTEQLRWMSRAAYVFGKDDASTVWVPSAAKAIPFPTWAAAIDGPLELPALSALWLRTQRQRGAWITRGMSTFMLPEVEIQCAGLNVAMVRELLRELAGRLLRHHEERVTLDYDANAPAVPGCAARLYRPSAEGPIAIPLESLATVLELGQTFTVGEVECTLVPGRQGPRQGESYGRWGAIALRPDTAWWLEAA